MERDLSPEDLGLSPTVQVRIYRNGKLIRDELCETAEEASDLVATWSEFEGIEVEVDDLSAHHEPDQILEPSPPDELDEDHPREARETG